MLGSCMLLALGCKQGQVQETAYVGNGRYEGPPPLCFQLRKEARFNQQSTSNLWAHFNNTCQFPVQCDLFTSVRDDPFHVALPGNGTRSLLVEANSPERSFDVDMECAWEEQ